jgi:DNA-binding NarL/FixJ family response regulator
MSSQPQIRVFSVDDHPLLREGIGALINNQPDMVLVGEAATGGEAIQLFRNDKARRLVGSVGVRDVPVHLHD